MKFTHVTVELTTGKPASACGHWLLPKMDSGDMSSREGAVIAKGEVELQLY